MTSIIENKGAEKLLLSMLVKHILLDQTKLGHAYAYVAPPDLGERLEKLGGGKGGL